ncbi:YjjG family noncanonical pyrimidine nucleotidase [Streptococcus loxodontisalivarius]|uniref:Hydrolase of the HAD superfamily n=1 Tax=Streptococcus loxodontisalivarius TaxID=1349415 RepID=A0ABS2PVT1_9STRE|nr:YjjG family noncanonical pyrimidine nucleotidase [Streptococcus loxodontisalivarius]MBM7643402.1 putative hydrolase of the HAD superfamily [Streptococcus loxodontisalivarius]
MSYKFLLFDLDHTLLDFDVAEDIALEELLREAGVTDIAAYKDYYIPMNKALWEDLALGRISKAELINTRFAKLFSHFGQTVDGTYFAQRYQHFLSQQGQTFEGAADFLAQLLSQGYRLLAATNGVTFIQKGRLAQSDIETYFEQVFISDEVGAQKPQLAFYEKIAEQVAGFDPSCALMIGDSLTADIQGGNDAGIDTAWFNPNGLENRSQAQPTYIVSSYEEILNILNQK